MQDATKTILAEFRAALVRGEPANLEAFAQQADPADASELFSELLAVEYQFRQQRDQPCVASEYQDRYPNYVRQIGEFFAAQDSASVAFNSTTLEHISKSGDSPEQTPPSEDFKLASDVVEKSSASSGSVGRYRLEKIVGRGGFGEVWLAKDPVLNRVVAIKRPRSDIDFPQWQIEQFLHEARRVAQLNCPGIVRVHDVGYEAGRFFIISEFIDGETLEARIKRGPVPVAEAVELVAQIAETLHGAHLQDIFHRDIKPGNILLDRKGKPFVTDFGLAVSETEQLQERGAILGTWMYMSPEQARGESHLLDGRTDIYSLGVLFYQLLTNRLPFIAKDKLEYRELIINRDIRPPRMIMDLDTLPRELERICLKSVEKRPSNRYQTAIDLAEDLRNWQRSIELERESSVNSGQMVIRPQENALHHWQLVLGSIACLFIVVVIGLTILITASRARNDTVTENQKSPSGNSSPATTPELRSIPTTARPTTPQKSTNELPSVREDWINRLGREPRELEWRGVKPTGTAKFVDDQQGYEVNSGNLRMVSLGQTKGLPIKLAVRISQSTWVGNCGLFFGYHEEIKNRKTTAEFQLLYFKKHSRGDGSYEFRLQWNSYKWTPEPKNNPTLKLERGFQRINWPESDASVEIEVELARNQVQSIRLNGHVMEALVVPTADNSITAAEMTGDWGLFHRELSTLFSSPTVTNVDTPRELP